MLELKTKKKHWPRSKCLVCEKKIRSISGYCIKHSPIHGKYKRTENHKKIMSETIKNSISHKQYIKGNTGKKNPNISIALKKSWENNPTEREKARERGIKMANDPNYIRKLSLLSSGENNRNCSSKSE